MLLQWHVQNFQVPSRTPGLTRRTRFESVTPKNDPSAGNERTRERVGKQSRPVERRRGPGGGGCSQPMNTSPRGGSSPAKNVNGKKLERFFERGPLLRPLPFSFPSQQISIPDKTARAEMYFFFFLRGGGAFARRPPERKSASNGMVNEHGVSERT